jgi:hypothetical protein
MFDFGRLDFNRFGHRLELAPEAPARRVYTADGTPKGDPPQGEKEEKMNRKGRKERNDQKSKADSLIALGDRARAMPRALSGEYDRQNAQPLISLVLP